MPQDSQNRRQLLWALALYSSGSIFGPIIIFGGIGFLVDSLRGSSPLFLLIGVGIAFIATNLLLYKKVRSLSRGIAKEKKEEK